MNTPDITKLIYLIGRYFCGTDRDCKDFTWSWTAAAVVWYVWIP